MTGKKPEFRRQKSGVRCQVSDRGQQIPSLFPASCPLSSVPCLLISLILLVVLPAQLTAQNTPTLPLAVPISGESFRTAIVAVDSDWDLTFAADSGTRTLPAADLLRWGRCAEIRRGPVVLLADGGLLCCDLIQYDGRRLTLESPLFGSVQLSRELVAGIVFQLPADRHEADILLDWAGNRTDSTKSEPLTDNNATPENSVQARIRLLNGDELAGRIKAIDDGKISIVPDLPVQSDVKPIEVECTLVTAMRFTNVKKLKSLRRKSAPLLDKTQSPPLYAWAGMSDGSLLATESINLENGRLRLRLLGDSANSATDLSADAADLVFLQPVGPKTVYLSDLEAAEYRHVPYLELPWSYKIDRNVTGGRLRCGGRIFIKGLGVHSSARLTYILDRPYARFEADTGIDDSAGPTGSVRFRVNVDGHRRYAGHTVRSGDVPTHISVDVSGAKRLELIVDFGDRADQQDYADWLDARLITAE